MWAPFRPTASGTTACRKEEASDGRQSYHCGRPSGVWLPSASTREHMDKILKERPNMQFVCVNRGRRRRFKVLSQKLHTTCTMTWSQMLILLVSKVTRVKGAENHSRRNPRWSEGCFNDVESVVRMNAIRCLLAAGSLSILQIVAMDPCHWAMLEHCLLWKNCTLK